MTKREPGSKRMINYTPEERFWSYVDKTETCWLWTGALREGYGRFWPGEHQPKVDAHRFSYELHGGTIPDGFHVDHLCHDSLLCTVTAECPHRRCVNPAHLNAVTPKENVSRAHYRELCRKGHSMADAYLKWDKRSQTFGRSCAECGREYARNYPQSPRSQKRVAA